MSEKPVIFISHSSKDSELAGVLKVQIETAFEGRVKAFVASYYGDIGTGEKWLPEILANLKQAQALIVISTPDSKSSRWVGFEIGFLWNKIKQKKVIVYPVTIPKSEVFSPLDPIQGASLAEDKSIDTFFASLDKQFGNCQFNLISHDAITARANNNSQTIKFTEEEIIDKLTQYVQKGNLKTHVVCYYHEIDEILDLPSGSARKHLVSVAHPFSYRVDKETENGIKFNRIPRL